MPQVTSELVSLVLEALPDLGPAWPSSVPCSALLLPWSRLHPSFSSWVHHSCPWCGPCRRRCLVSWQLPPELHFLCPLLIPSKAWLMLSDLTSSGGAARFPSSYVSPRHLQLPHLTRLSSHLVLPIPPPECFTNSWFFQCLSSLFRQPSFLTWDVLIASYFYFNIISPKPFSRRQSGWGFPFSKCDGII